MEIEVAVNPNVEHLRVISNGIQAFNEQHLANDIVYEPDTKFAVFIKDDNGQVLGGIRATAFWNYCFIQLLWLSPDCRGSGWGSKLINAAERHAVKLGFEYMRTETLSFEACPFYEKLGYQIFGELQDHPKGHTTYCLVKKL